MSKQNIEESVESRVCFEELEDWVREKIQGWVQELLEEEVTELLGRGKSERRRAVDAPLGYRNGYGKPRRLTMNSGTIQVRRPRVRDLEERFESRVLPLFAKRTRQVRELIPELYLHGLALARRKSERRRAVDAPLGYRNGYGKPRRLTMNSGTIQVRRPRVRDLEERFESRVLPLFAKRTRQVRELIPELYLHGLGILIWL